MPQSIARPRPAAGIAQKYPKQYARMVGYLHRQGVRGDESKDLASEAWTHGLETFDPTQGLELVQWVWWVLQNNTLPAFHRRQKQHRQLLRSSNQMIVQNLELEAANAETTSSDDTEEYRRFISSLREALPTELCELLDAMEQVTTETDSVHIYGEVSRRLNISLTECRKRVKRIKRAARKMRPEYEI